MSPLRFSSKNHQTQRCWQRGRRRLTDGGVILNRFTRSVVFDCPVRTVQRKEHLRKIIDFCSMNVDMQNPSSCHNKRQVMLFTTAARHLKAPSQSCDNTVWDTPGMVT